jgi:hypothetical protein
MRFMRFSSDGDSVVQERIRLRLQMEEQHRTRAKAEVIETRRFARGEKENARSAARCRVLAGIDELLRSTAAAA